VFGLVDESRTGYKKDLQENMLERNKYRELISNRKDKERALLDIIALEKVDLTALQAAIDSAIANKVDERVVTRGQEKLQWLTYCKEVEVLLTQALTEKVKDKI